MSNRRKNAQNCWFFGALFPLSSPRMLMNDFIKAASILFWELELFLGTRIVHELFRLNETFNATINGH